MEQILSNQEKEQKSTVSELETKVESLTKRVDELRQEIDPLNRAKKEVVPKFTKLVFTVSAVKEDFEDARFSLGYALKKINDLEEYSKRLNRMFNDMIIAHREILEKTTKENSTRITKFEEKSKERLDAFHTKLDMLDKGLTRALRHFAVLIDQGLREIGGKVPGDIMTLARKIHFLKNDLKTDFSELKKELNDVLCDFRKEADQVLCDFRKEADQIYTPKRTTETRLVMLEKKVESLYHALLPTLSKDKDGTEGSTLNVLFTGTVEPEVDPYQ